MPLREHVGQVRGEMHGAGAPAIEPPLDQRSFDGCGRDDQDREAREIGRRGRGFSRTLGRQRHDGAEGRALAWRALDLDAAAHPLDDALGDGEAQAGAAELARGAAIGLLEFVEDARLLSGRNADAGVANLEDDLACIRAGLDDDANAAGLGELDGVAGKIEQHLAEPRWRRR